MGILNFGSKPKIQKSTAKLSEILKERGYIYQHSAPVEEITDGPARTLYLGIDPTADSMHVGHLQAMIVLRRFLEAGHRVILLIGGGTGMIGDPSGKNEERVLLDEATLRRNLVGIQYQAKKLFASGDFRMANNLDWLGGLKVIEFLRDIGKNFSINAMIQRDSVKERLENREQGISYTEFSYMLLQAYDFLHLFERRGCELQIGASDQWGNMVSGVDLIRRKTGKIVYALSFPLLINKATGKKFGKSEGGTVWLGPEKTSPFQFYQFWFKTDDADVEEHLFKMTLLSKKEIDTVMSEQKKDPSKRPAQKKLAFEVTALVHGQNEAHKAQSFESVPTTKGGKLRNIIKDISTSELRRLVEQGAVSSVISGNKIDSIDAEISNDTLRIGKHRFLKIK